MGSEGATSSAAEVWERPRPATTRRISLALNFAAISVFADLYITQPILPLLSQRFGVSAGTAGLTISVVVAMIAFISAAYGFMSDILGRKPVMVAACVLLAVPTFLCALAPSFKVLLVFRALQGLLMPGVTAVAVAYLGDHYAGAELGPKVGGWIAATVAGGLTGRVGSGLIASWIHWRAPFVFFGAWTLVAALALGRMLPQQQALQRVHLSLAYRGMFGHFRNRRLVGSFLIGGSVFFATIGVFTYLPYYLTAPPFLLSTPVVSSIYFVYLAGVATSLVTGRLARNASGRWVMAVGLAIAALGVVITEIETVTAVLIGLVVLCIGMFTVQSTAPAFVNSNAPTAKGGAGSLYTSFYYLGASLGSALPGYALQVWGWTGVVSTCIAMLSIGLLADLILCR